MVLVLVLVLVFVLYRLLTHNSIRNLLLSCGKYWSVSVIVLVYNVLLKLAISIGFDSVLYI